MIDLHDALKSIITRYAHDSLKLNGIDAPSAQELCQESERMLSSLEDKGSIIDTAFLDQVQTADATPITKQIINGTANIDMIGGMIQWLYNRMFSRWLVQKSKLENLIQQARKTQNEVRSLIMLSERSDGFLSNIFITGNDMIHQRSNAAVEPNTGVIECARKTNKNNIISFDDIKDVSAKILTPGFTNLLDINNTTFYNTVDNDPDSLWIFSTIYPLEHNGGIQVELTISFKTPQNFYGITVSTLDTKISKVRALLSSDGAVYKAVDSNDTIENAGHFIINAAAEKIIYVRLLFTIEKPKRVLPTGKEYTLTIKNISFNKAEYKTSSVAIFGPFTTNYSTDNVKVALSSDDVVPQDTDIQYQIGMRSTTHQSLHFRDITPINHSGRIDEKIVYTPFTALPAPHKVAPCTINTSVEYPYFSQRYKILYNDFLQDGTFAIPADSKRLYVIRFQENRHYSSDGNKSYYVSHCFIDNKDGIIFDAFNSYAYVDQQKITAPTTLDAGWHVIAVPLDADLDEFENWLTTHPVIAGYQVMRYTPETLFINNENSDYFTIIKGHDPLTDTEHLYGLVIGDEDDEQFTMIKTDYTMRGADSKTDLYNSDLSGTMDFQPQEFYVKAILKSNGTKSPMIKAIGLKFDTFDI